LSIVSSKKAEGVIDAINNVITKEGCPEQLQSDNGGEFVNEDMSAYQRFIAGHTIHSPKE